MGFGGFGSLGSNPFSLCEPSSSRLYKKQHPAGKSDWGLNVAFPTWNEGPWCSLHRHRFENQIGLVLVLVPPCMEMGTVSDTEDPRTHPKQAPVHVPPFFPMRWQQHGPSPRFPFRLRLSLLSVLPPLPALAEPGLLEVLVTPCWGHRRYPARNQEGPPELERSGSEVLDRGGMRGPSGASLGSGGWGFTNSFMALGKLLMTSSISTAALLRWLLISP